MVFNPPARLQPTPAEIAEWLQGQLLDAEAAPARISGVATLKEAKADQLSFVASQKVVKEVAACAAGLLLVQEGVELPGRARIVVKQVWPAMAAVLTRMYAPEAPPAGIHPTAIVAPTAQLGEGVSIGPYCVIGEHVVIGARTTLGPHCIVADGCTLGADCRLVARVTLTGLVHAGARVILHPGCVLGSDGFKYEPVGGIPYKIPQVGAVILEDDVEIGANACIDRAFLHETRLGRFCKIDNIVQIAHNVTVGPGTLMAGMVGIAGSVKIGAGCMFGGASGVADQITMGDGVKVGAGTCVLGNVGSGETIMGSPHMPIKQWFRVAAETAKLTELRHRVRRLEERVAAGEAGQDA